MKKEKIEIDGKMTVGQVIELKKNAKPILMGFGMHCFCCPMSLSETLEEAAEVHGIELDLLIDKLNKCK